MKPQEEGDGRWDSCLFGLRSMASELLNFVVVMRGTSSRSMAGGWLSGSRVEAVCGICNEDYVCMQFTQRLAELGISQRRHLPLVSFWFS